MTETKLTSTVRYKKDALFMEDVALRDIADKFGTPAYCYSAAQLTENFNAYKHAMLRVMDKKDFTICYATKSNGNVAVLTLLGKLGAGADIVSGGELARAQAAKIPASRTVFSGVGKSEEELTTAIRLGLFQINVESEPELEMISCIAKKLGKTARIAIRVNPDVDAKTHAKITTGKKENKFGIDIKKAPALYKRAKSLPGIDACGVAVHIGSQLTSLAPFKRAYEHVAKLVVTLRKQGHKITRVDLGGGLGIVYRNETLPDLNIYALMIRDIISPLGVHIILEPGRSVSGNAGVLLSRVRHIKKGDGKEFLILDAAMNDLMRPALYDAYHPILACKKTAKKATYDVVGPVCETGDTFMTGEKMPQLKAGDLVALMCAGAYGASMSSHYNTRPLAHEVLVSGKTAARIRKAETVQDIVALDIVPKWV